MGIFLEMLICASFCLLVDEIRGGIKERRQRREKEAKSLREGMRKKSYGRLELPPPGGMPSA